MFNDSWWAVLHTYVYYLPSTPLRSALHRKGNWDEKSKVTLSSTTFRCWCGARLPTTSDRNWVAVSVRVSMAATEHHEQKQLEEERAYFSPPFHTTVRAGTGDRNLEVCTEAGTMEECCLLACSWWLAQPAFLGSIEPSTQKWFHPQWAEPSYIDN